MNFKTLFSTPKKAAAVIAGLLAIAAAVGIGIAYVIGNSTGILDESNAAGGETGTLDESTAVGAGAIGAENARNFAFADAGVDPASAQAVHVVYERFEGEFVYSVEFIAGGMEYTYKINAGDGSVVRKESRTAQPDGTAPLTAAITLEEAQEIALTDAGVDREEAIFSRAEAGTEGGLSVYLFRFYAANMEYEYEINAATGAVYSKKTVTYMGRDPGTVSPAPTGTAAPTAQPTAEPTQPPATEQPEPTQPPTTAQPEPTESAGPTAAPRPTDRPGMYIGMDAAKRAALDHAGVSAGEARFTQARMDYEDGTAVYVLSFYTSARRYEYRINARTGAVYSREVEDRD